jgi:hypothetical protein
MTNDWTKALLGYAADPDPSPDWKEIIAKALPAPPVDVSVLKTALTPLSPPGRAMVIDLLGELGRAEAIPLALEWLDCGGGTQTLLFAKALARLGHPKGLTAMEELFQISLGKPKGDPEAVPLFWILDEALPQIGTPEALALKRRLERLMESLD